MNRKQITFKLVVPIIFLLALTGCSSSGPSDPKSAVISMFGAMEKDDQAALAHLLDLPELMQTINEDYALKLDSPREFTNPVQILEDLTGEGLTKQRWFSLQRIIGETHLTGESATVEVTFVDKGASAGYRTKFGLHVKNGKWKIYSFKVLR